MRLKWILVAGIIAVVSAPLAMLVLGLRPEAIENRALATAPTLELTGIADTETYEEIEEYVLDRLPGRDVAVSVDARMRLHLLGESSSEDVVIGTEGWLYFAPTIDRECMTDAEADDFVREVELARSVAAAAGRDLVFTIAPDKAAIYPQHLGVAAARASCAKATREAIVAAVDRSDSDAAVLTWDALTEQSAVDQVYHRHDNHWNALGGAIHAKVLVESIEPGISASASTELESWGSYEGALTKMLGTPWSEPSPRVTTTRPGIEAAEVATIELEHDKTATRSIRPLGEAALLEGSALLFHDSFGFSLYPHLRPFHEDLTTVYETHVDYEYVRPLLAGTDTVVIQKVEMWTPSFVLTERLSTKMASAFLEDLDAEEIPIERSADTTVVPPPPDDPESVTYLVVAIDRIPLETRNVWTSATGPDETRKLGGFRQRVAWEMPPGVSAPIELFEFPEEVEMTAYYVTVPLSE